MATANITTNLPPGISQDANVQFIHPVSGRVVEARPHLDGTVNVRNLDPGPYRVRVMHPNLPFPVFDQTIRVLTRPTFVPIKIDLNIFENTPVRDIAEADLAPVQSALTAAGEQAGRQNGKQGGEPIYADDWNSLADTVADVADATLDLTRRVSATGHDHPELIEKMNEIQRNLERFLDVFGRSMAQVQRQLEQFALQLRTERALDRIPELPPIRRAEVDEIVRRLDDVRVDNPYVYTTRFKRVGEELEAKMVELLTDVPPDIEQHPDVVEVMTQARTMSATRPASSFEDEVQHHLKVDAIGSGNLSRVVSRAVGADQ